MNQYIGKVLERAEYKRLDNQTWFAEIPEFILERVRTKIFFSMFLPCNFQVPGME